MSDEKRQQESSTARMSDRSSRPQPSQHNASACDELRDLLPGYVSGASDAEEIARVAALLEQCPEMRAELAEYAAITTGFYERVAPAAPPPDLHKRLMARVRAEQQPGSQPATSLSSLPPLSPVPRGLTRTESGPGSEVSQPIPSPAAAPRLVTRLAWGLAAAAALLLVVTNVYWLNQLNAAQDEMARLREQRGRLFALASTAELERIELISTEQGSSEPLAVFWVDAASGQGVLTSSVLPDPGTASDYQLWLIADGTPLSAGVFRSDTDGLIAFDVPLDRPIGEVQAIAISVEPLGGSDAPSTNPIAIGAIEAT
ncbi:MAG: anti-sigma factor [Chloroflexi bacterium]|nr:anti-sigma factor [Chloroflexota bacterium]